MTEAPEQTRAPWQDPHRTVAERVADLIGRMTLEEKVQQLVAYWPAPSAPGEPVAPMQNDMIDQAPDLDAIIEGGLGQLTRVFGTAPVTVAEGVERLDALQNQVVAANRFGIPAMVHEECLTGLMAWGATLFPAPLCWGASFDPDLVEQMASAIGTTMRRLGTHHGLAPVLDVTRDYRWGRTEETIGEDPYLVGTLGAAYVRGLERNGVVATLKHFAGYSASRAGRNFAPAAVGAREFIDVLVEPFVMAIRLGGARSVMHSYADVDGIPAAANEQLLTGLLREELGFRGVVVADYFGISFLQIQHGVADSSSQAAALALTAGVDIELPIINCYGTPLIEAVRDGRVDEAIIDRAVSRVLTLKCELGLLDPDWKPAPQDAATVVLDPPEHRQIARRLAEESVILLANNGILPLTPAVPGAAASADSPQDGASDQPTIRRIALVGPLADDIAAMVGCYSFVSHVLPSHPDLPLGIEIPTLAEALRAEFPGVPIEVVRGCEVADLPGETPASPEEFEAAVAAARNADVCVLALGDRAGLFGRGTSGEGCDVASLHLPGRQAELAEAILATGTPTVLVLLSGRPYALGKIAPRAAAVVQAFFPGEEGGSAVAGVLSGRVEVSGRLPVSIPRDPGGQPGTYLHSRLAGATSVSSVDPSPLYPFGHGLTWTEFTYSDLSVSEETIPTDGTVDVEVTVTNVGARAGTEVVQLYLEDPVASVVRPVRWLAGWARVRLEPGAAARVRFSVHADRTSFTGRDMRRIVEPGVIGIAVGRSSEDILLRDSVTLTGAVRTLGQDRVLEVPVTVKPLGNA